MGKLGMQYTHYSLLTVWTSSQVEMSKNKKINKNNTIAQYFGNRVFIKIIKLIQAWKQPLSLGSRLSAT